jgi:hypothetical protein
MKRISLDNYEAFLLDFSEGNLSDSEVIELKSFLLLHPDLGIDLENLDLPTFPPEELCVGFKSDMLRQDEFIENELLLNYLEKNLDHDASHEVELLLQSDPMLFAEFELLRKTILSPDLQENLLEPSVLLKTEEQLIENADAFLYMEGLMTALDKAEFETKLKRDENLCRELDLLNKTKLAAEDSLFYPNKEELKREAKVLGLFNLRTALGMAASLLLIAGLSLLFNILQSDLKEGAELKAGHQIIKSAKDISKSRLLSNAAQMLVARSKPEPITADKAQKQSFETDNGRAGNSITNNAHRAAENLLADNQLFSPTAKKDSLVRAGSVVFEKEELTTHIIQKELLLALEDDEEEIGSENKREKNKFWKRAIKFAQQVNGLGLKAVHADEKGHDNFVISINDFKIEKK